MFELTRRNNNNGIRSYNPFQEMEDFERSFWGDPVGSFFRSPELTAFKMDVTDQGDSYLLECDMPGFDKQDIHLDLEGDTLTIRAERHARSEDKDAQGKVIRQERSFGSYSRQLDVSAIDVDRIRAAYEDGVLKLTMPKQEPAAPAARSLPID